MNKYLSWPLMALALSGSALLAGCNSGPKTLYQWESYQPQVYEYFKGETPKQAQAEAWSVICRKSPRRARHRHPVTTPTWACCT